MALKIRLARGGRKKKPFYSIVVAENTSARDGKFIEKIGTYSPLLSKDNQARMVLKQERVEYWLSKGAEPTDAIVRQLQKLNIGQQFTQVKKHNEKRAKVVELKKAELEAKRKAEAEAAAKEAAEKAAAEKAAAEEAAAEEAAAKAAADKAAAEAAAAEAAAAPAEAPAEEAPAA